MSIDNHLYNMELINAKTERDNSIKEINLLNNKIRNEKDYAKLITLLNNRDNFQDKLMASYKKLSELSLGRTGPKMQKIGDDQFVKLQELRSRRNEEIMGLSKSAFRHFFQKPVDIVNRYNKKINKELDKIDINNIKQDIKGQDLTPKKVSERDIAPLDIEGRTKALEVIKDPANFVLSKEEELQKTIVDCERYLKELEKIKKLESQREINSKILQKESNPEDVRRQAGQNILSFDNKKEELEKEINQFATKHGVLKAGRDPEVSLKIIQSKANQNLQELRENGHERLR